MSIFDPPEPPNPTATAAAQTGTNVSTAIANSYLGNVNQSTPQGNLNYDVTNNFTYTDPSTGQTFTIPRWTATQTLTPTGQQTFGQGEQAKLNMAQISNASSGQIEGLLGTAFDPNKGNFNATTYLQQNPDVMAWAKSSGQDLTEAAAQHYRTFGQYEGRGTGGTSVSPMGDINLFNQVGMPAQHLGYSPDATNFYGSGGAIQRDLGDAGAITRTYGPQDNYGADRQRIEAGLMERMNPQLQIEQDRLRNQLANQGIAYGSTAYTNAMDNYNRMANDARLGVIGVGGQEQQRMDQMAAQRAGFQNAAQQQAYAQLLGRGQFYNQAQQQAEGQAAARSAFYNQAAQQQYEKTLGQGQFYNQAQNQMLGRQSAIFNAANQLRNQSLQEGYQQRNQPINEITALLSGSQVSSPSFINAQRTTIPTTDVAGLINQNFAQQNDIYKTQSNFWGDIIGGGLGAAGSVGSAWMRSDVRSKENIEPLGSVFSAKGEELPIYAFDYKNDDPDNRRHVGPMAQDVERIKPSAVKEIGGVKHIKTDKLGSIFGRAA